MSFSRNGHLGAADTDQWEEGTQTVGSTHAQREGVILGEMKDRPAGMKEGRQELEAARWSSWPASMCKGPEHRGHWAGVTAPVTKGYGGQMSSSIKTLTVFKERFTEA